jgi:hypothetical protein
MGATSTQADRDVGLSALAPNESKRTAQSDPWFVSDHGPPARKERLSAREEITISNA